jgi:hypothetical protein
MKRVVASRDRHCQSQQERLAQRGLFIDCLSGLVPIGSLVVIRLVARGSG